jgi:hypothetical protein
VIVIVNWRQRGMKRRNRNTKDVTEKELNKKGLKEVKTCKILQEMVIEDKLNWQ